MQGKKKANIIVIINHIMIKKKENTKIKNILQANTNTNKKIGQNMIINIINIKNIIKNNINITKMMTKRGIKDI